MNAMLRISLLALALLTAAPALAQASVLFVPPAPYLSATGDNHIRVHEEIAADPLSSHYYHVYAAMYDTTNPLNLTTDIHVQSGSFQMLSTPKSKSQSFDVYNGTNHTPCFYLNDTDNYHSHVWLYDETAGTYVYNIETPDYYKSDICP